MKRVTGIGGIFFKAEDPANLRDWYRDRLGFNTDQYGGLFKWREDESPDSRATTSWSPMGAKTDYFSPSQKPFMFNYRVEDLVKLLEVLKEEGVTIVGEIQEFEYGKFGWIMDPEGNKIELWEPIDAPFLKEE